MIIQKPTITFENSNHDHSNSANGGSIAGLAITAGKTLTITKTMTLTASGDSAVITLPNATVTFASPGTAGNILTSDGTDWTSAPAPQAGDPLQMQIFF